MGEPAKKEAPDGVKVNSAGSASNPFILFNLLRIPTPVEIAYLTKISSGVRKISLTDVILGKEKLGEDGDNQAPQEILEASAVEEENNVIELADFAQKAEGGVPEALVPNGDEEEIDMSGLQLDEKDLELSRMGLQSKKEQEYRKQKMLEKAQKKKLSATEFLLQERKKMHDAQSKLQKSGIFENYRGIQKISIKNKGNSKEEELRESEDLGTLVNKKQY